MSANGGLLFTTQLTEHVISTVSTVFIRVPGRLTCNGNEIILLEKYSDRVSVFMNVT